MCISFLFDLWVFKKKKMFTGRYGKGLVRNKATGEPHIDTKRRGLFPFYNINGRKKHPARERGAYNIPKIPYQASPVTLDYIQ
jgi:hypothetical protein